MKKCHVNDEIYHFGIKGQQWGIRRFQNEDGTLTSAGKERYSNGEEMDGTLAQKGRGRYTSSDENRTDKFSKRKKAPKPESSAWRPKEAKYLSDEELNRRNNRLQREKQYQELTQTKGQKFMKSLRKTAGKIFIGTLIGAATAAMGSNYKEIVGEGNKFIAGKIGEVFNPNMDPPLDIW